MSWPHPSDWKETTGLLLAALGSSYLLYQAVNAYRATPSSIHTLRGPKSPSWLSGTSQITHAPLMNDTFESWVQEYGTAFATHAPFCRGKELLTTDTQAAAFILNKPLEFFSSITAARNLLGPGLFGVEGSEHKKQRKIINPAFRATVMKDILPMHMEVAHDLREMWRKELSESIVGTGFLEMDVLRWLSSTSLEAIGLAGFGRRFNALGDSSSELAGAFRNLSNNVSAVRGMGLFTLFFPFVRHIPMGSNVAMNQSKAVFQRVSLQLIMEKKAEVERLGEESTIGGKDLLSILIRANLQENAADRLGDETLAAEIGTFLLAAQGTTALAITWCLHALAMAPSLQSKLRDEVTAFPNDSPSMEELNGLSYLSNVVKEILRLRSSATSTTRIARFDTTIPLALPIVDRHGKEVRELFVRRGDSIIVHLWKMNTRFDLWGLDALEFNPERWDKLPEAVSRIPSMFSNLASFGAGARGCPGWQFAVLEIKAVLFALVRTFQFDIDPQLVIKSKFFLSARPVVQGQEEKGPQLPLRVTILPS